MSDLNNHYIGHEVKSSTTSAPSSPTDGHSLRAITARGVKEVWLYVTATGAGTGFTATAVPWIYVVVDPSTDPMTKDWIAAAPLIDIPLDGSEGSENKGQIYLIDSQGGVGERIYLEWTAVGAELRATLYGGIPA